MIYLDIAALINFLYAYKHHMHFQLSYSLFEVFRPLTKLNDNSEKKQIDLQILKGFIH